MPTSAKYADSDIDGTVKKVNVVLLTRVILILH